MTELSFLLDLLLNHKLPMATRALVSERIKFVEAALSAGSRMAPRAVSPITIGAQSPSTQAILDRNPDLAAAAVPVEQIAQTPAAMAALNSRAEAIANAGKIEKGMTRPRRF